MAYISRVYRDFYDTNALLISYGVLFNLYETSIMTETASISYYNATFLINSRQLNAVDNLTCFLFQIVTCRLNFNKIKRWNTIQD